MERYSQVGYVFCPAVRFQDGRETEIVDWSVHGPQDKVFPGLEFLKKLLHGNCVSAPTGMVRKICYEKSAGFHLICRIREIGICGADLRCNMTSPT